MRSGHACGNRPILLEVQPATAAELAGSEGMHSGAPTKRRRQPLRHGQQQLHRGLVLHDPDSGAQQGWLAIEALSRFQPRALLRYRSLTSHVAFLPAHLRIPGPSKVIWWMDVWEVNGARRKRGGHNTITVDVI